MCTKSRVGAQKHSAEPHTVDDENKLWSLGVTGTHSPLTLLWAVFFYNGKNFCLWGGEEHRNLKLSQLKRTEKGYIIYTENSLKNPQGGVSQLKLKNKSVELLEYNEAGDHCHCRLLDLYISKLGLILPTSIRHQEIKPRTVLHCSYWSQQAVKDGIRHM